MLGVNIVIPDFTYLIENKDKIRAIVITHGHELYRLAGVPAEAGDRARVCDIPYLRPDRGKLREHRIGKYELNVVKSGDEIRAGVFKVGFFHVNHSIPDSCRFTSARRSARLCTAATSRSTTRRWTAS